MCKKTALLLLFLSFLVKDSCYAMRMATRQVDLQSNRSTHIPDEAAAKELIQQLLGKKYIDMANQVSKLSDEQKKFILTVLNKVHSLSTIQIHLQTVLSGHTKEILSVAFKP